MAWATLAAAIAGLVIGLCFRAPALVAATLVLILGTVGVALHLEWSFLRTIAVVLLLQAVHQAAYLLGVLASTRR